LSAEAVDRGAATQRQLAQLSDCVRMNQGRGTAARHSTRLGCDDGVVGAMAD
jgi:hypothetical protein